MDLSRSPEAQPPETDPGASIGEPPEPDPAAAPVFRFLLYISGNTEKSRRAVANAKRLCEEYLPGRYELEVIDLYQQPEFARDAQLVAVPTLVKQLPLPLRRFIGDLSDPGRVLVRLQVRGEA
jgi:circadian clock protein KaiB